MEDKQPKSSYVLEDIDIKTIKVLKKSNLLRPLIKNSVINNLTQDINLTNLEVSEECSKFYESKDI